MQVGRVEYFDSLKENEHTTITKTCSTTELVQVCHNLSSTESHFDVDQRQPLATIDHIDTSCLDDDFPTDILEGNFFFLYIIMRPSVIDFIIKQEITFT